MCHLHGTTMDKELSRRLLELKDEIVELTSAIHTLAYYLEEQQR